MCVILSSTVDKSSKMFKSTAKLAYNLSTWWGRIEWKNWKKYYLYCVSLLFCKYVCTYACRLWKKITRQAYKIILNLNERLSHALILSSAFPWDKTLGQLGKIASKNGWCQVDNFKQGWGKFNMLKYPCLKACQWKEKNLISNWCN